MKTILLFLLGMVTEVSVGLDAICQTQLVRVEEGDGVTLPCHLLPSFNVFNYTVDWKRVDVNKVVHLYRHRNDDSGPQMEQYRSRTQLNHVGLSRGILDLHISSARLSDSGQYRCNVPKLQTSCIITITVEKKDENNKTNKDDFSTSRLPLQELTTAKNPDVVSDGEETKVVIVCCVIFTAVAVAVAVTFRILVKCGTVQNWSKRLSGRKGQKEMALSECATGMLETQEVEGAQNPEALQENCLGNLIREV